MAFELNEISNKAKGGTELMIERLSSVLDKDLLDKFQIIPSRVRNLDPDKVRIFWAHDLPQDPESVNALSNGKWARFNRLVFVSYWQREQYMKQYGIPYSKTKVLQNCIVPIENAKKPDPHEQINIIYHTTPHRGLNILASVFDKICEKHSNVHLDVYSSFKIYGWDDRDLEFQHIFDILKNNPNVTYHGAVSNDEVREALKKAHIFAYPSIWAETSCLALIEAMSAGCVCVHPDYAALQETAANWNMMYDTHEDINEHANIFARYLDSAINLLRNNNVALQNKMSSMKQYTDFVYDIQIRKLQWEMFLNSIKDEPTKISSGPDFIYRTS